MTTPQFRPVRRLSVTTLLRAGVIASLAFGFIGTADRPAEARVVFGIGVGVPLFPPAYYPPPGYYPPPVYYPPPPVYYAPPPVRYVPSGQSAMQTCEGAGGYTCPMERPISPGSACFCPGNRGERIPGRAN